MHLIYSLSLSFPPSLPPFLPLAASPLLPSHPLSFPQGERGTGYGVALLNTVYGDRSDNFLLKSVAPQLVKH